MSRLINIEDAGRNGTITRFTPAWWRTDFNLLTSASLVTDGSDGLVFRGIYRRNLDISGSIWLTEDEGAHPLCRYEGHPSYRGLTLRFRWQASGTVARLDTFNGPTLGLETYSGRGAYIRLWNYRVLPNPNSDDDDPYDQVIEIPFDDELFQGLELPGSEDWEARWQNRAPIDDVKRIVLSMPPRDYMVGAVELAQSLSNGDTQAVLSVPSGLTIGTDDQIVFPAQAFPGPEVYRPTGETTGTTQTVTLSEPVVLANGMNAGDEVRVTSATLQRFDQEQAVEVRISDIQVTGSNTALALNDTPEAAHPLRMTDGYDNAYPLTPERVVRDAWHLGYRQEWVMYLGISHFHNLIWSSAAGRFLIDPSADATHGPFKAWLKSFAEQLDAHGFDRLWISVSLEVLADFIPGDWGQKNHAGEIALTGWSPPSSLISPCHPDAVDWLGRVAEEALAEVVAGGLAPRYQIGEPWWWDGSFTDQAPYIYDAFTLQAYNDDTGLFAPTPWLENIFDDIGTHGPYLDWCCDRLGELTQELVVRIEGEFPTVETAILIFTPQIFRPDSAILTRLNFPASYWVFPAFDILQIEDYDWVVAEESDLLPITWETAYERLAYPAAQTHYFGGFVLEGTNARQWKHIDKAIAASFEVHQPAETFVWSREQVMRDGFVYSTDYGWPDGQARLTAFATCWRVTRRDGLQQGFTTHDKAMDVDGLTYRPAVSFEPSEIESGSKLNGSTLDAIGGFDSEEITAEDIRLGLYDGAEVRIFQVDWRDPDGDQLLLTQGIIGEIVPEDHQFRAELRGPAARLNQPFGEVYQPHCRAELGDNRCKVDLSQYELQGQITAVGTGLPFAETQSSAVTTDLQLNDAESFNGGVLTFTSGSANGLSVVVRQAFDESGRLIFFEAPPASIAVGDSFTLTPGCDKLPETCKGRYDNFLNFRGEPHLPGADAVLRVGNDLPQGGDD